MSNLESRKSVDDVLISPHSTLLFINISAGNAL